MPIKVEDNSPLISSKRHLSARNPSISTTATRTPNSPKIRLVLSLVLATLSCERRIHEGGLNEKRLLNQLRLGEEALEELEEKADWALLGPESSPEYGTGSMETRIVMS